MSRSVSTDAVGNNQVTRAGIAVGGEKGSAGGTRCDRKIPPPVPTSSLQLRRERSEPATAPSRTGKLMSDAGDRSVSGGGGGGMTNKAGDSDFLAATAPLEGEDNLTEALASRRAGVAAGIGEKKKGRKGEMDGKVGDISGGTGGRAGNSNPSAGKTPKALAGRKAVQTAGQAPKGLASQPSRRQSSRRRGTSGISSCGDSSGAGGTRVKQSNRSGDDAAPFARAVSVGGAQDREEAGHHGRAQSTGRSRHGGGGGGGGGYGDGSDGHHLGVGGPGDVSSWIWAREPYRAEAEEEEKERNDSLV